MGVEPATLLLQSKMILPWLHFMEVCLYGIEASSVCLGPREGFSLQPYDLWLLVVEPSTLVSMNQVDPAMMHGHGGGSIYSRATFHVYSIIARYQSPYLSACHSLCPGQIL